MPEAIDKQAEIHTMIETKMNMEFHTKEAEKNNLTSQMQLSNLQKQFDKFAKKYPEYDNKSSQEMMEQYKTEFGEEFQMKSQIECSDPDAVMKLYNEKYAPKGKKGDDKDKKESIGAWILQLLSGDKDKENVLYFNSEKEFKNFLNELAEQGVSFQVMDAKGKMQCYSNGDGNLRHADNGAVMQAHETFRTSNLSHSQFMKQEQFKAEQIAAHHATPGMAPPKPR